MKKLLFIILFLITTGQVAFSQRVGLFLTQPELDSLKVRAGLLPGTPMYRHTGDVQAFSPGDGDRIISKANQYISGTASSNYLEDRYTEYFKGGPNAPVQKDGTVKYDPETAALKMMHCARHYLLTGSTAHGQKVRQELLRIVDEKYLYTSSTGVRDSLRAFDWNNKLRWVSVSDVAPGFTQAEWLQRLAMSYDDVKTLFSDTEKAKFLSWLKGGAYYMRLCTEPYLNGIFPGREHGDYTISGTFLNLEKSGYGKSLMYYNGPYARVVSRAWGNRRVAMATAYGLIGILTSDATLTNSAKRFFKELITYSYTVNGYHIDFLRGIDVDDPNISPDKGFMYASLPGLFVFAEALARTGDFDLYEFSTTGGMTAATSGADATSDGVTQKNILMIMKAMLNRRFHLNTTRYATSDGGQLNSAHEIDGVDVLHGNYSQFDIIYAVANRYYKDTFVKNGYTRNQTAIPTAIPYRSTPQPAGPTPQVNFGFFAATHMQWAKTENWPSPYPGTVVLSRQSITFPDIADVTYGASPITLTATASSGLPVTYSVSDAAGLSISGTTLTFKKAGTYTIKVNQGGNSAYFPAPEVSQIVTVEKKALTVTASNATRIYNKVNPTFAVTYAGFITGESSSVLTTQPTITTTATQASNVGTYAITASNGAALNYAISYLPGTLTITKGTVTLVINTNLNRLTTDVPFQLSVTALEQGTTNVVTGLPLGYAKQSGTSVTSISAGGLVTLSGTTGTSVALFTVGANTNYYQVTNTVRDIVVTSGALTAQAITFNALAAKTYGDGTSTLSATGGGSGNPVTFTSNDPSIATCTGTNGTTLTIVSAGLVNIVANQAGNGSFEDAPAVVRQLTVNKKALQVTADNKSRTYGLANPTFTVSYSGFIAGENSSNLTAAPIATTAAITTSTVGTYAIVPSGGSADNYTFTPYTNGVLTITQASQAISFPSISDKGNTEVPFQLNATASSGLTVTYSIISGPAVVSGSTLTLTGSAGTVVVRAAQAGNVNFSSASTVDQSFNILTPNPTQNQIITVADPGTKVYSPGQTFLFTAASNSGLVVTTTVVSGPGTIVGSTVTITGAGSIVLKSVQAGNSDYYPAPDVFTTVVVNKATQVVSADLIPDKYISSGVFSVVATASSGLTVTLTGNNKVTQNTSTTFTPLALGAAVITAVQAGNDNYYADTLLLTFNIRSTPTTGTVDILEDETIYNGFYQVGTGTSAYTVYRLVWPSLGGSFTANRFTFKTGVDTAGNVLKGNIIDNFQAWRYNGTTWVKFLDVTGNTQSSYDVTLPNVPINGMIYITCFNKDIRKQDILRAVTLWGVGL